MPQKVQETSMMHINYKSVLVASAILSVGLFTAQAAEDLPIYNGVVNYTGSAPGSYSYDEATGVMTINGCGADIWGTSDAFYYVYTTQEQDVDFDYYVKLNSFTGGIDQGWMKAGLMVREASGEDYDPETGEFCGYTFDGNARYYSVQSQRSDTSKSSNLKWITQWRDYVGADVNDDRSKRYGTYVYPQWQRLRRIGSMYYSFVSADGENWEQLWSEDTSKWQDGPLGSWFTPNLAVGIAVTSHEADSNDAVCKAVDFKKFEQHPVAIEVPLESETVMAGQKMTLVAKVSGYSPYEYVWKKDGQVVASGTELLKTTFRYSVPAAAMEDAGTYTFEVKNVAEGVTTTKTSSAKISVARDTNPPEIASAQALENTVGITFNEAMDVATATNPANYTVSGKNVLEAILATPERVILTLNSKVAAGSTVDVTAKNLVDLSGNKMADKTVVASATFALSNSGKPFVAGTAQALGGDGFLLNNQGLVNWGSYDEDTFVYRAYKGDFDIRMKLLTQSPSTEWARAGLMIRGGLDDGRDGKAGALHHSYMEVHHTPIKMMDWSDENAAYTEPYDNVHGLDLQDLRYAIYSNTRLTDGADTSTAGTVESFLYDGVRVTPLQFTEDGGELYIRIGRVGSVINTYYGIKEPDDSITWTRTDSHTFTDMGETVYAGPHYGIEGNNFGACASLTNEFKNPTTKFYMSIAEWDEGKIEDVAVTRNPVSKKIKAPASFSLLAEGTGDPITYQWYKDGVAIPGAIFGTYSVAISTAADAGVYTCELMNFGSGAAEKGSSAMTEPATIEIVSDTTAPTVTSSTYNPSYEDVYQSLSIKFSEAISPETLSSKANYKFVDENGNTMPVDSLVPSADTTSVTVYAPYVKGMTYTLTLSNLADYSGNVMEDTDLTFLVTAVMMVKEGYVTRYYYSGDQYPSNLAGLITSVRNGTTATSTESGSAVESPSGRGDNYATYIKGILLPPETGNYRFAVTSDDQSQFFLSTDSTPANLSTSPVSEQTNWSDFRKFESDTCVQSGDVYLEAGKPYYFEVFHYEGTGGDSVSLAWSLPSQGPTKILNDTLPISSDYIAQRYVLDINETVFEIVDQPAESITFAENSSFELPVEVNCACSVETVKPIYCWYVKNDYSGGAWVRVATMKDYLKGVSGENTATLVFKNATYDAAGTYRLNIDFAGETLATHDITLVSSTDTEPPTATVRGNNTMEHIVVTFSEPVSTGFEDPANYKVAGLDIKEVMVPYSSTGDFPTAVVLKTSRQTEGKVYTVVMNNIMDCAYNVIKPNYSANFTAFVYVKGYSYLECFEHGEYTTSWDTMSEVNAWVAPAATYRVAPQIGKFLEIRKTTFDQDNCVERVSGYITPEVSGTYQFRGCSDDDYKLFISTDESIENLGTEPVAWEQGWCTNGERVYDFNTGNADHTTYPDRIGAVDVALEAGKTYYYSAVLREGTGGDHVNITWFNTKGTVQANGTDPILTGDLIGIYVNPDTAIIDIIEQPEDVVAVAGDVVTFAVTAVTTNDLSAPISYQWYLGGEAFEGATTSEFTLTALPEYDKANVYCKLSIPGKTVTTDVVTLTVTESTTTVRPIETSGSGTAVVVQFDGTIEEKSGLDPANYTIAGATVQDAAFPTSDYSIVQLTVSGCTEPSYTLTVANVCNASGIPMPEPVTLTGYYTKLEQMIMNPNGVAGYAVASADNTITLCNGGGDFWNAAEDSCLFLYEQITGDFDAVVCIESIEANVQWTKTGLNFRASTDADSAHIAILATPTRLQSTTRPSTGANSEDGNNQNYDGATYPEQWIRLKRVGNQFTAYRSLNGMYWTQVRTETMDQLPTTGYLGLVYSSQDKNNTHVVVMRDYRSDYIDDNNPPTPDPSEYRGAVVGCTGEGEVQGFYDYDAETGIFEVWGCGADVWGTRDDFYYVYREVAEGDFTFTAKLEGFQCGVSGWGKAGLMLREGTSLGLMDPQSRYVATQQQREVNPSNVDWRSQYRQAFAQTVDDSKAQAIANYTTPSWHRIQRVGTALYTSVSEDGVNWKEFPPIYTGEWGEGTFGANLPLYIGMWCTSHNKTGSDSRAVFSNVVFQGGEPVPPVEDVYLGWDLDETGENLILRWQGSIQAFVEVAPTAVGPWTVLPSTAAELIGGAWQMTIPMAQECGYYRLSVAK